MSITKYTIIYFVFTIVTIDSAFLLFIIVLDLIGSCPPNAMVMVLSLNVVVPHLSDFFSNLCMDYCSQSSELRNGKVIICHDTV